MSDSQASLRARRDTIGDALRRAGARFRNRTALSFGERVWSFAELDLAADRVARRLRASGLGPGDRVGAFGRNSDGYLIAWLGCARAGLVHVPVNYALTAGELEYIMAQSGASALLYQTALAATAETVIRRLGLGIWGTFEGGGPLDVIAAARDAEWGRPGDPPPGEGVAADDLVQLQYTSGTTGQPKGAMMTHRALLTEYTACIIEIEYTRHDRALAALPLYHTAQLHAVTMPQLLVGAATVLIEAPAPDLCLALIERHKITTMFAPPTVWISLLRHADFDRRDLSSLRTVMYGASIMPVPVLEELRRRLPNARPFQGYGQTEIAPLATILKPEEHDARPASCGRPILTVETRVVDAEMRDVAPGERGEIVHRSPQLLLGYWNKPEETAAAFKGGWFHSGDVATMDEDGYLYIVDRVKDVINTGGVLVASREVEDALFTHPAVAEVAVIAIPDAKWIEAIAAVVVLRAGAELSAENAEAALIAHARERLAQYKLPKRVFVADSLPKNTAGKLLKRELRARYAGTADAALGHG